MQNQVPGSSRLAGKNREGCEERTVSWLLSKSRTSKPVPPSPYLQVRFPLAAALLFVTALAYAVLTGGADLPDSILICVRKGDRDE